MSSVIPNPISKNTTPNNKEYTEPNKEHVLSVLNSEIENIRSTQTSQGWTSWGLIAGIAAALWLLTDDLKAGTFQAALVGALIILFSTGIDFIRWFINLFQNTKQNSEIVRFRWSSETLSSGRLIFVTEILRSILIILVAFYVASGWWLPISAVTIAYGLYSIVMLLCIISTFTDAPFQERNTKISVIFNSILVTFWLLSFLFYLRLVPPPIGDLVSNYRISGLLVTVSYLILWLLIITKDSPVLRSLINIRRNLAFNNADVTTAVREAEIALYGMQFSDAINEELHLILSLVDRANQATDNLIFQIQQMHIHLPTMNDSKEIITAKTDLLIAHRKTCESILRDRETALNESFLHYERLIKRRNSIEANIPKAVDFFNELNTSMNAIFKEVDTKYETFISLSNEYDRRLNSFDEGNK